MAESVVSICNKALDHARSSEVITSIDERTKEARACKKWYEHARDTVLEDFPWPFATSFVDLALVEEEPNTDWQFSYRYPQNCARVRKILNPAGRLHVGQVLDTVFPLVLPAMGADPARIPFTLGFDDQGKLIYTDMDEASAEITGIVTNPTFFSSKFVECLSWKLAALIAPGLTRGDQEGVVEKCEAGYQQARAEAWASAGNETQSDKEPDAESIRARG